MVRVVHLAIHQTQHEHMDREQPRNLCRSWLKSHAEEAATQEVALEGSSFDLSEFVWHSRPLASPSGDAAQVCNYFKDYASNYV